MMVEILLAVSTVVMGLAWLVASRRRRRWRHRAETASAEAYQYSVRAWGLAEELREANHELGLLRRTDGAT